MVDIEKRLNPAQYAAVTATEGPLLVIAGAGSGKTRVIEYRVLHLVRQNVDPRSILLLTFTKRASREMLGRAARHDPRCAQADGGTFHSFCYRMLRRYAKNIGFDPSFTVLDESDAEEAVKRCATRLGMYEREKRFPRKNTLKNIISVTVNKNMSVENVLRREYPHFARYAPDIKELRQAYAEYKITKNFMDYDDLLVYMRILLDDRKVREKVSARYRYIMVDEYQDTNALQGDITYFLGRGHKNVMVVGDDAQSIYGFRGASHENIMRFPSVFPECRIMKLEENYRSTQSILDVGNSVLENMKNKYSKCLISAIKATGDKPRMAYFKDVYEEASWIAGRIKEYNDQGVCLCSQAVLFRSLYVSIPLQAELSKRNIPYSVFGGLKFYETAHVKDVMAHLKVLSNIKDELSWHRILSLLDGIGPKRAEMIAEEALVSDGTASVSEKVFSKYAGKFKSGKGLIKLGDALVRAQRLKEGIGAQFGVVLDYYDPILRSKFDDWHVRVNDLDTMRQISTRYESLDELLADFAIEPPERGAMRAEAAAAPDERPLTVSTIHSAKGLEWDNVFLMGAADGILPSKFALEDEDGVEEEQRLFYVAITRARRNLFMSVHHEGTRGGVTQFNRVSRFIDAANVASKLDSSAYDDDGMRDDIVYEDEDGGNSAGYNKDTLLKKIIDSYE